MFLFLHELVLIHYIKDDSWYVAIGIVKGIISRWKRELLEDGERLAFLKDLK